MIRIQGNHQHKSKMFLIFRILAQILRLSNINIFYDLGSLMNTNDHICIDNDNDDEDKLMLNSIDIYMLINYIYIILLH
jgi:hypothetical protein